MKETKLFFSLFAQTHTARTNTFGSKNSNRALLLLLLLGVSSSWTYAQDLSKISPAFRYLMANPLTKENARTYPELYKIEPTEGWINGRVEKRYDCIVYTRTPEVLERKGLVVRAILPTFVTAWLTFDQMMEISTLKEVQAIENPEIVYPSNDMARGETKASLLHAGKINNTTYKGDGVIVAIYDSGIDWDHLDFRSTSNPTQSRILRIWDQTLTATGGESPPSGFNYGVEYTQAHINDELDGTPAGFVRETDINGHGTHVAGTAAGNGATGGFDKYAGTAPNADIVVVKGGNGSFSSTNTINALTYLQNLATSLGKPIVVNMSIGGQTGPHDGTRSDEIAINTFCNTAGRVVVVAAGNDDGNNWHKALSIAPGARDSVQISVPSASAGSDVFQFTLYNVDATNFTAKVFTPNRSDSVTLTPGQSVNTPVSGGNFTVLGGNVIEGNSGDRRVNVYLTRTGGNPVGNWTIRITNTSATTLDMHGWLNTINPNYSTATVVGGNDSYLSASPGNASSAITVGSYMTKLSWYASLAGGTVAYPLPAATDSISDFSSNGPRRDGVQKPEISAPGQGIASCYSSNSPLDNSYMLDASSYRIMQGTSMATPATAGCVALMLQAMPTATYSQIKTAIQNTATTDAYTNTPSAAPNAIYGYGRLDVFRATAALLQACPTTTNVYKYDDRNNGSYNSHVGSSGLRLAVRFTPDITGKLGGVYVKTGNTDNSATTLTVEVRTNNAGNPGTLMGSKSFSAGALTRNSWVFLDMASANIDITNATDYHIVLITSAAFSLGHENISVSNRSKFSSNGISWTSHTHDFRVRSFVHSNVSFPTMTATIAQTGGVSSGSGVTSITQACAGTTITLTANTAGGTPTAYQWTRNNVNVAGALSSSLPLTSGWGVYRIKATDAGGCVTTSDSIAISFRSLPNAQAGTDKNICIGNTVTLGAANNASYTYSWHPSTNLSAANISNPVATVAPGTTTYTVFVSQAIVNSGGLVCSKSDAVLVNSLALPSAPTIAVSAPASLVGNANPELCEGSGTIVLSPSNTAGNTTLQWLRNGTQVSLTSNLSANLNLSTTGGVAASYTAKVKGVNGCFSPASNAINAFIKEAKQPTISPTGSPLLVCASQNPLVLTANVTSGTPAYAWYKTGTVASVGTGNTLGVTATATNQTFKVTATYPNSCIRNSNNVTLRLNSVACREMLAEDVEKVASWVVYPNPAQEEVTIRIYHELAETATLTLTDVLGKVMWQQTFVTEQGVNEEALSLARYSAGVYFLSLDTATSHQVQKLVKE